MNDGWDLKLATTVTTDMNGDGIANAGDITHTTRYDAQGVLVLERLSGGIIKRSSYETGGELVTHTWNGPVVQPDSSVLADQPWVAWSPRSGAAGFGSLPARA